MVAAAAVVAAAAAAAVASGNSATWTGTITVSGVTRQGNGKFKVFGTQCTTLPDGDSFLTSDRVCTIETQSADISVTIEVDPKQSYCVDENSRSSSNYSTIINLSQSQPTDTLTIEFVNNKASRCQNGPQ